MISWAKLALGQTQEVDAPTQVLDQPAETLQEQEPVAVFTPASVSVRPTSRASYVPWLCCFLIVIGMGWLAGGQFRRAQQLTRQLQAAQAQFARLHAEKEDVTKQLAAFQAERNALDEKVFSLGVQLSSANSSLERASARLTEAQELAKQLAQTQAQLQAQMASARDEREAAAREAERFEQEKAELRRSVSRLRQQLALVERDYRELSVRLASVQAMPNPGVTVVSSTGSANAGTAAAALSFNGVELAPVVVRTNQQGIAAPLQGRLVDINEQHQFVIIDKGLQDGVREGMVFDLRHGETFAGEATVIRVRPQLAACNFRRARSAPPLRIGDLAVARTR